MSHSHDTWFQLHTFLQPGVSPNANEVIEISEIPKSKERRRKREQDAHTTTVEQTPLEESPSKAASKKKKRVGDNTSKIILEFVSIWRIWGVLTFLKKIS